MNRQIPSRRDASTSTDSDILQALGLLAQMPPTKGVEISNTGYFIALEGVTRKRLFDATKRILRGGLGHSFFPSPPEFRMMCDKVAEEEARKIRREREQREQAGFIARQKHCDEERTPEALARAKATYEKFCVDHDASRAADRAAPIGYLPPPLPPHEKFTREEGVETMGGLKGNGIALRDHHGRLYRTKGHGIETGPRVEPDQAEDSRSERAADRRSASERTAEPLEGSGEGGQWHPGDGHDREGVA